MHHSRKRRRLLVCALASVLLHLLGLAAMDGGETAGVRILSDHPPARFAPARWRAAPPQQRAELVRQHPMEAYVLPPAPEELAAAPAPVPAVAPEPQLREDFARLYVPAREQGLAGLAALAAADSLAGGTLDLLRLRDMADAERATLILDPRHPQRLYGYVNFTFLRLYGAGSFSSYDGGQNRPGRIAAGASSAALADLARYMRDYTGIYARVRPHRTWQRFLSRELLKDPIHFLFEGGGLPTYGDLYRLRLFAEERALLGEYLRGGGFVYIEGSNRFLRTVVDELEGILRGEGRLVELGRDHPIYRAYYVYGDGFPGEYKRRLPGVRAPDWYYPAQFPSAFYPRGLWGVEMEGGRLAAVLSDVPILGNWQVDATDAEGRAMVAKVPLLSAATNIVVFALTQKGGLTARRELPPWAAATGATRRLY